MTSPVKLDAKLLDPRFNPFRPICENTKDNSIKPFEYRPYRDYLNFLKIIATRLMSDHKDRENKNDQFLKVRDNYSASAEERTLALNSWWESVYQEELDLESFVIFTKILLNKTGYLMERLLNIRSKHNWSDSFTKHREWLITNSDKVQEYSKILKNMHWYDSALLLMRDKIIEHGMRLAGSARNIPSGVEYSKVNESFMLSGIDYQRLENIIPKYTKLYNELRDIHPINPPTLELFINRISEHNIKLTKEEYDTLGEIVMHTGGVIGVDILSERVRRFLEDCATLIKNIK
jgi:hypothetical protein